MKINMGNLWNDNISGRTDERAENRSILLQGKRGRIFCTYLMAAGKGNHPAVIFCHGFPGNEENMDIAHALRRIGFHVMNFHYSGSWGSDGDFSLANCLEDTESVLDLLLNDESLEADLSNLFIFGQSMGGFIVYHTLLKRGELKAGVLAMPCDFGLLASQAESDPEKKQAAMELLSDGAQWLKGTSGEKLYEESLKLAEERTFEKLAGDACGKRMLVFGGTLDTLCPPETMIRPWVRAIEGKKQNRLEYYEIRTDHMFTDARCTVTDGTASFLQRFLD